MRVAIILDDFEPESFDYIEELITDFVINAKVVHKGRDPSALRTLQVDLVILDYGGIAASGAWDVATSNIKEVIRWAEDHPSSLVLIWTEMTQRVYKSEVEEQFGEMNNIMLVGHDDQVDLLEKAGVWLGARHGKDQDPVG